MGEYSNTHPKWGWIFVPAMWLDPAVSPWCLWVPWTKSPPLDVFGFITLGRNLTATWNCFPSSGRRSNSSKSPVILVLVIPVNHPHFLKIPPPKKKKKNTQSTAVEGLFFFRDGEPNDSSVTLRPKSLSSLRFARHVSKVAKCVARASREIYIVSSK